MEPQTFHFFHVKGLALVPIAKNYGTHPRYFLAACMKIEIFCRYLGLAAQTTEKMAKTDQQRTL